MGKCSCQEPFLPTAAFIRHFRQLSSMEQQLVRREEESLELDVPAMAARLDRTDILLLRQFYLTRSPHPNDTEGHVLRLLVDKLKRNGGLAGKRLSYSAIRHRLENLVALGLLGKILRTNPKIYYPLDNRVQPVRRVIFYFAAELVGLKDGGERV